MKKELELKIKQAYKEGSPDVKKMLETLHPELCCSDDPSTFGMIKNIVLDYIEYSVYDNMNGDEAWEKARFLTDYIECSEYEEFFIHVLKLYYDIQKD